MENRRQTQEIERETCSENARAMHKNVNE